MGKRKSYGDAERCSYRADGPGKREVDVMGHLYIV